MKFLPLVIGVAAAWYGGPIFAATVFRTQFATDPTASDIVGREWAAKAIVGVGAWYVARLALR